MNRRFLLVLLCLLPWHLQAAHIVQAMKDWQGASLNAPVSFQPLLSWVSNGVDVVNGPMFVKVPSSGTLTVSNLRGGTFKVTQLLKSMWIAVPNDDTNTYTLTSLATNGLTIYSYSGVSLSGGSTNADLLSAGITNWFYSASESNRISELAGGGITATEGTNIAAYQAQIATNGITPTVTNSAAEAGVVLPGGGNVSKVWKTDGSGVPAWRDDAVGEVGAGITAEEGTNIASYYAGNNTNFTLTVGAGATNEALRIGVNGTNDALRIGAAATNHVDLASNAVWLASIQRDSGYGTNLHVEGNLNVSGADGTNAITYTNGSAYTRIMNGSILASGNVSADSMTNRGLLSAAYLATDAGGKLIEAETPAGAQTPWTGDIDGAGFSITNLGTLEITNLNVTDLVATNLYTSWTNVLLSAGSDGSLSNVVIGSNISYDTATRTLSATLAGGAASLADITNTVSVYSNSVSLNATNDVLRIGANGTNDVLRIGAAATNEVLRLQAAAITNYHADAVYLYNTLSAVSFTDTNNVLYYGATPDDISDDTAAFLAASAVSQNVYVPKGSYFIDGLDLTNCTLWSSEAGAILKRVQSGSQPMIRTRGTVAFKGLVFDGNRSQQADYYSRAISTETLIYSPHIDTSVRVESCILTNGTRSFIYANGPLTLLRSTLRDLATFDADNTNSTMFVVCMPTGEGDAGTVTVSDNTFSCPVTNVANRFTNAAGIYLSEGLDANLGRFHFVCERNTFDSVGMNYLGQNAGPIDTYNGVKSARIVGNVIVGYSAGGIMAERADNVIISQNQLYDGLDANDGDNVGISYEPRARKGQSVFTGDRQGENHSGAIITDNIIGTGQRWGIRVSGDADVRGNIVTNICASTNGVCAGIFVDAPNVKVVGNTVGDCAGDQISLYRGWNFQGDFSLGSAEISNLDGAWTNICVGDLLVGQNAFTLGVRVTNVNWTGGTITVDALAGASQTGSDIIAPLDGLLVQGNTIKSKSRIGAGNGINVAPLVWRADILDNKITYDLTTANYGMVIGGQYNKIAGNSINNASWGVILSQNAHRNVIQDTRASRLTGYVIEVGTNCQATVIDGICGTDITGGLVVTRDGSTNTVIAGLDPTTTNVKVAAEAGSQYDLIHRDGVSGLFLSGSLTVTNAITANGITNTALTSASIVGTDAGGKLVSSSAIGAATATTPAENDNDTSVATTAYVQTEISTFISSGGNIGAATATTPAENDNDTSVATTAYVQTEIAGISGGDSLWGTNATTGYITNKGDGLSVTGPVIITSGGTSNWFPTLYTPTNNSGGILVSNGITLGGVYRATWPEGGGTVTNTKSFVFSAPTSTENATLFYTPHAIVIDNIQAHVQGSSPSVTLNIAFAATRNTASSNLVFSSNQVLTSVTGTALTASDTTLEAGWIWFVTAATSGTITDGAVVITYH